MRFEIGDRVEIIEGDGMGGMLTFHKYHPMIGRTGQVTEILISNRMIIRIEGGFYEFPHNCLRKIEDAEVVLDKFLKGSL